VLPSLAEINFSKVVSSVTTTTKFVISKAQKFFCLRGSRTYQISGETCHYEFLAGRTIPDTSD